VNMKNNIMVNTLWKHSKSGRRYGIIGFAKHSETLQDMVIYQADYGDRLVWTRPLEMWEQPVEIDGKIVPRFVSLD
jgi:hypothetical protein